MTPPWGPRREAGSVALEAMLVLPLVALLLVAVLGTVVVGSDQLAVHRAARAAARTLALTGDQARARAVAIDAAPNAAVSTVSSARVARVTVSVEDHVLGVAYAVHATAAAPVEPGVP